jgi:hypothetical protein
MRTSPISERACGCGAGDAIAEELIVGTTYGILLRDGNSVILIAQEE